MVKRLEKYAIVQHSGYGYAQHIEFKKGLESCHLSKESELKQVERAKGKVFDSYVAAEDYCMKEMYPETGDIEQGDSLGLIPHAAGAFAAVKISGLAIYVPLEGKAKPAWRSLADGLEEVKSDV